MKAANRFGAQTPSGAFSHMQQTNLPHRASQHQPSNSSGLPPPSFGSAFAPSTSNPFAPTGNVNGLAGGFGPGSNFNGGTGLASREAVEGFAYGAQLQQQSQNKAQMRRAKGGSKSLQEARIRDVWASNMKEEMDLLEHLVDKYNYISMDTEFPGIVARPMGAFTTKADYHYQCLRCNVDLLKVIQLGISLFDSEGNSPPADFSELPFLSPTYTKTHKSCPTTWQFNFQFSLEEDMYSGESITFLQEAGMDLKRFATDGIQAEKFGSRLITSGLAHFDDVHWISFHSGYDFAYVVKLMNCNQLPEDETQYRKLLQIYFPAIYDIKFLVQHAQRTQTINDKPLTPEATTILNALIQKNGLQNLADEFHIKRVGQAHYAGSDALLTGKIFWEVKNKIFGGTINPDKYLGQVWGLNVSGGAALFSPLQGAGAAASSSDGLAASTGTPNLNGATIYHSNPPTSMPSTPARESTGLAATPSQQSQRSGEGGDGAGAGGGPAMGSSTPANTHNGGGGGNGAGSGGGGVFGAFSRFGKS